MTASDSADTSGGPFSGAVPGHAYAPTTGTMPMAAEVAPLVAPPVGAVFERLPAPGSYAAASPALSGRRWTVGASTEAQIERLW